MQHHPIPVQHPTTEPAIPITPQPYRRSRYFGAFLICCALFLAGFAVTAVWRESGKDLWGKGETQSPTDQTEPPTISNPTEPPKIEQAPIPAGATPIILQDLSYVERGIDYLNNETFYHPDVTALLQKDVSTVCGKEPVVLILHTHTSEGYLQSDASYLEGDLGKATYTKDSERSVVAVGRAFAEALGKKGITAIHCTVMHDESGLSGSYARAAESIQFYLQQYPSIRYVVDIHRDAVLTAEGEYVKAATEVDGKRVAQILPVVGSDGGGEANKAWQSNLAFALQLRQMLNANERALCRPVMLRNATYNQEMAPAALLLEIGTGANSIEEAIAAATLAGEAMAQLIKGY